MCGCGDTGVRMYNRHGVELYSWIPSLGHKREGVQQGGCIRILYF